MKDPFQRRSYLTKLVGKQVNYIGIVIGNPSPEINFFLAIADYVSSSTEVGYICTIRLVAILLLNSTVQMSVHLVICSSPPAHF